MFFLSVFSISEISFLINLANEKMTAKREVIEEIQVDEGKIKSKKIEKDEVSNDKQKGDLDGNNEDWIFTFILFLILSFIAYFSSY